MRKRLCVSVDPSVSGANGWCAIDDFVDKANINLKDEKVTVASQKLDMMILNKLTY